MEKTLSLNTLIHWLQNDVLSELFEFFKIAVVFAGTNDNPMSSAFPLVCALRNEVYALLESKRFSSLLGVGACDTIKSILEVRFNLDGIPPEGRKVGSLDQYQIWCSLVDPYFRKLNFKIPSEIKHIKNIVKFFIRGRSNVELRREILREYQFFKTGSGSYQSLFDKEEDHKENISITHKTNENN